MKMGLVIVAFDMPLTKTILDLYINKFQHLHSGYHYYLWRVGEDLEGCEINQES